MVGPRRNRPSWVPRITLKGPAEARYVRLATQALALARLNNHYPESTALRTQLRCLGPEVHRGLYAGIEIDRRSGLPTAGEWRRVSDDLAAAEPELAKLPPREDLAGHPRRGPTELQRRQLRRRDYYETLRPLHGASLPRTEAALRKDEGARIRVRITHDQLGGRGLLVRTTLLFGQQRADSVRGLVRLRQDHLSLTEHFAALAEELGNLAPEAIFARLRRPNLDPEQVVQGTIGPFFLPELHPPAEILPLLAGAEAFAASFGLEMATLDLAESRQNDPLRDLLAPAAVDQASQEEQRRRLGYQVFHDRKFVVPAASLPAVRELCRRAGTENIAYPFESPAA
jgi:hypothetical protein